MKTERLNLRLAPEDLATIDAHRGDLTRSAYLLSLLPTNGTSPVPPPPPAGLPSTVTETRGHFHRFLSTGQVRRHPRLLGVYEKHARCECGAERWG